MPEKYGFSGWLWILAAAVAIGFVVLGSYLVQTQQQLKVVESALGGAKEATIRAKAGAAELAEAAENLKMELKTANAARNEYQGQLHQANATIAELSKKLETTQSDLEKRQSQLQAMEAELKHAKQAVEGLEQAADQAKAEASNREEQIAKLRQGIASCEEFFDEWEVRGAPASISAIAALGREAAAAKDCIDKRDVAAACKHWRGLLVEIEKMGPPLSESRADIEDLMRQNHCEAEGNSTSN